MENQILRSAAFPNACDAQPHKKETDKLFGSTNVMLTLAALARAKTPCLSIHPLICWLFTVYRGIYNRNVLGNLRFDNKVDKLHSEEEPITYLTSDER